MINNCEILKEFFPFWDKLNDDEKNYLGSCSREISFSKNQTITRSEGNCLGIILIKSGELKVSMMSDEGREIRLFTLKKGDVCVLSASCILSSITFDVFIEAVKSGDALLISSSAFENICKKNLYAENFLLKKASERFSDVMKAMEQILFMSFEKRLAACLTNEEKNFPDGVVKITHEEIAEKIGSVREVVSRNLKKMEQKGIVSLGRGSIKIIDRKALDDLLF